MSTPESVLRALAERYAFVSTLGEGGMAVVSRVHDHKLARDVALTVLKPGLTATLAAERFLQEVRVTAALQHPHILPLFDSGEVAGTPWYAMPFVDGESLRQRLDREGRLGVVDAVRIARQVASALSHAHRHGVVHRDVKPENILLHDGNAYVADFGIALALARADTGRLSESGLLLGTPHYLSPEQAGGDARIDARCDQWALGAVLYEMLAGTPPHTGPTLHALLTRIVVEPPAPLDTLRPALAPAVATAVTRALAKVPGDRFPTIDGFDEALAAVDTESPGQQSPRLETAPTSGVRRPSPSGYVAGTLVILALSAALHAWRARDRGTPPPMADESTPSVATLPVLAVVPCADRTGNPDDT
jgi:serine/threonine-protein kinase